MRKGKKLTQKDLSSAIGVSTQVISNWEREYTYPDYEDLLNLANFFEHPIEFILTGKVEVKSDKVPIHYQFELKEVDIEDLFMEDVDFYFRNKKMTRDEINKILEIVKLVIRTQ